MATKVSDIKSAVKEILDEIGVNDASFISGADNGYMDTLIESKIDDAIQMIYMSADEALLDTEAVGSTYIHTDNIVEVLEPPTQTEPDRKVSVGPVVKVYLTDKFVRFVSARITNLYKVTKQPSHADVKVVIPGHEWSYPVYQFIPSTGPEYAKLKNPYTTGTEERPKVGFTITPSVVIGGTNIKALRTLELYSLTNVESIEYEYDDSQITYEFEATADCQVIYKRERTKPTGVIAASDNDTYNIGEKLIRPVMYCIAGLVLQAWRDEHADSMLNIALTMAGVDVRNQQLK